MRVPLRISISGIRDIVYEHHKGSNTVVNGSTNVPLMIAACMFLLGSRGYSTQELQLSPISVCPGNFEDAPMSASRSMKQLKTRKRKGTSPAAGWSFIRR